MQENTIQIRVPHSLLEYGLRAEEIQEQVAEWLTLSLFVDGRISSGKAASLLGLSRIQFLQLLRRRGISYIDYAPEEVAEESAAANTLTPIGPE
ncbi:MAG TPA: UPF0175 family protein [Promineifilum sp.]|nr:UPF0175 family protein [Promineifilum sp.]HRO23636.1 UPF0175 family protein [Promineifilum sp.]HRO91952.1 UPF0175 family protein [Promineifilum sp.]HRQ14819.1 UPF0175 family protein [Promineifilum sp.]